MIVDSHSLPTNWDLVVTWPFPSAPDSGSPAITPHLVLQGCTTLLVGLGTPPPISPLYVPSSDPITLDQASELCHLAAECQALGSKFTKKFCNLSGLKATHMAAQSSANEVLLSGHQAHDASYTLSVSMPAGPERERTLCRLHEAAQKVQKEVDDIMLMHLLRYDEELTTFMSSTEDVLNIRWGWVWERVHSILGATSCTPMACLSVMLQVLQCLPCIPWNLSFQAGFPTTFAHVPKVPDCPPLDGGGDWGGNANT